MGECNGSAMHCDVVQASCLVDVGQQLPGLEQGGHLVQALQRVRLEVRGGVVVELAHALLGAGRQAGRRLVVAVVVRKKCRMMIEGTKECLRAGIHNA